MIDTISVISVLLLADLSGLYFTYFSLNDFIRDWNVMVSV